MIQDQYKYFDWLKQTLLDYCKDKKVQICLFGSSVSKETFNDVDVAIEGEISDNDIRKLKDQIENSQFPYFVDIINLNETKKSFRDNILHQPVIWIKP